jgi:hypothetical protein
MAPTVFMVMTGLVLGIIGLVVCSMNLIGLVVAAGGLLFLGCGLCSVRL